MFLCHLIDLPTTAKHLDNYIKLSIAAQHQVEVPIERELERDLHDDHIEQCYPYSYTNQMPQASGNVRPTGSVSGSNSNGSAQ